MRTDASCSRPTLLVLAALACLATACETQSATRRETDWSSRRHTRISIEPCRSRAANADPEIEARATKDLTEELAASGVFEVGQGDASVVATCDIEMFEEGNAFERWIEPGTYPTVAQVAVTLWEQSGDRDLIRVRGKAAVRKGGLYTIGADRYILSTAMDEIVQQLVEWAEGRGGDEP